MKITHIITKSIGYNKLLWLLFKPVVKFCRGIDYYKKQKDEEPVVKEVLKVFKNPTVIHGPFSGLKYPDFESFGSAIYPKLLGCYEAELNEFWKLILAEKYDLAIDIGSAEGYYSVGIALKSKFNFPLIVVDISPVALKMVGKIGVLNNVQKRLELMLGITSKELALKCENKRAFILCDAEGFEKEIFNVDIVKNLANCDVLIETHDVKVFRVSQYLTNLFSETHNIKIVSSTDDMYKLNNYNFPELVGLTDKAKIKMMTEGRSNIQDWIFCTPK